MIGVGNLEVIHTGTLILYDWDILGSSIYIVDILRIDDLRIDDQSSILRSSTYRVFWILSILGICLDHVTFVFIMAVVRYVLVTSYMGYMLLGCVLVMSCFNFLGLWCLSHVFNHRSCFDTFWSHRVSMWTFIWVCIIVGDEKLPLNQ